MPIDWRAVTLDVNDRTYTAWNAHDPDAIAAVFADDAVLREAGRDAIRGRRAIRERAAAMLAAFPDFRLERVALVVDGNLHADRWIMTGTHTGDFFGMPPTGRTIRIEGATFTRLGADGLVVEDVHHVDFAGLLVQLGVG